MPFYELTRIERIEGRGKSNLETMAVGKTERFNLPDVAPPFVTVLHISSTAGFPDRNRPHYHPDTVELCSVLRGQLDWFVGEESYVVRPGEAILIPANVVHGAADSILQPCEMVAVHFAAEQLPPRLSSLLLEHPATRMRDADISTRVVEILDAHRERVRFFEERVAALGTLLAAMVVEFLPGEAEREESRLIQLAQRSLLGKGGFRPTVDEVAHRLGVSAVWLHKLFVRETGAPPGDWARAKRLAEAKRRLAEGTESNVTIAHDLGYSSGQTFATAFRKESGMTPSEYRELHQGGGSPQIKVYRAEMRETWVDGVRTYPPLEDPVAQGVSKDSDMS